MTVSRLRLKVPKSETRELAEYHLNRLRLAEPEAWRMSDSTVLVAFVMLAGLLALAALVLR